MPPLDVGGAGGAGGAGGGGWLGSCCVAGSPGSAGAGSPGSGSRRLGGRRLGGRRLGGLLPTSGRYAVDLGHVAVGAVVDVRVEPVGLTHERLALGLLGRDATPFLGGPLLGLLRLGTHLARPGLGLVGAELRGGQVGRGRAGLLAQLGGLQPSLLVLLRAALARHDGHGGQDGRRHHDDDDDHDHGSGLHETTSSGSGPVTPIRARAPVRTRPAAPRRARPSR